MRIGAELIYGKSGGRFGKAGAPGGRELKCADVIPASGPAQPGKISNLYQGAPLHQGGTFHARICTGHEHRTAA